MNIKASLMIALIACVMLVGVAAAESPDAGATWSTEKSFSMSTGYNYIDGTLTQSPADGADWWYSNSPAAGSSLTLYLDGTSYHKYVSAEMYNGGQRLMQSVHLKKVHGKDKDDSVFKTYQLTSKPVHVHINGFPGNGAYEFTVYKA